LLIVWASCPNTVGKPCALSLCGSSPFYLGSPCSNVIGISCCAVHVLFIPYCLGNSLIQYCWKVLCTIRMLFVPYHLGNFCSHFILGRLRFLCALFICHFILGPSAHFRSEHLSCASLALPLFGATLLLPVQLGAPFWSTIGLHCPYSNLVGVFFCWTPFSLPLYSGHLFRATTSLVSLHPYSSLLELSFGCIPSFCPLAWAFCLSGSSLEP